jgi:hypothetical protein
LIRQCLFVETISTDIKNELEQLFDGSTPDIEDLEKLLHSVAAPTDKIIFAVDGLDECPQEDITIVLGILSRLVSSSPSTIKIFLSSRQGMLEDIDKLFKTYEQVKMQCEDARTDIRTYVEGIVREKIENQDLAVGDPQLVQEIQNALIEGANGM